MIKLAPLALPSKVAPLPIAVYRAMIIMKKPPAFIIMNTGGTVIMISLILLLVPHGQHRRDGGLPNMRNRF